MAIYHLNASFVTRSTGRSPVAAAAYQARERLFDTRQGITHDYVREAEEVHTGILLPSGAPEWAQDRAELWNQVDTFEDHMARVRFRTEDGRERYMDSAQTAQVVRGALPRELPREENRELVRSFLEDRFVSRGLAVDYAIHWDEGNPHFHAMVTRRSLSENGFAWTKDREIVSRTELLHTRTLWADYQNGALQRAGLEARVDARSYADRGLDYEPTLHEGPFGHRLKLGGWHSTLGQENDEIRARNRELVLDAPEQILAEVSERRATFTENDLARVIFERVGGDSELFEIARGRVLRSREIVTVGEDVNGRIRYTTRAYLNAERRLFESVNALKERVRGRVQPGHLQAAVRANPMLTPEQTEAVRRLAEPGDLQVLVGRAGTGKTTTLRAVVDAYRRAGARVRGASLSGIAAQKLAEETGIQTRTLHAWERSWALGERPDARPHEAISRLTRRDVFIVDEAGMVGTEQLERVLSEARMAHAKVLLVGDPDQLQPIDAGAAFRGLLQQQEPAELHQIHRQERLWQREASAALVEDRTTDALRAYAEHSRLIWASDKAGALSRLVEDYVGSRSDHPGASQLVLAHERADVQKLNQLIRTELVARGAVASGLTRNGTDLGPGDRVAFGRNDNLGAVRVYDPVGQLSSSTVRNGSLGTLESIVGDHALSVRLDDGRRALVDLSTYDALAHGYAVTVHKSQGATVDRTFVLASRHMRRDSLYPALTRHREDTAIYASRSTFKDVPRMARRLGRPSEKDVVIDYSVPADRQQAWQRVRDHKQVAAQAAQLFSQIRDRTPRVGQLSADPEWLRFQDLKQRRSQMAQEILADYPSHRDLLRQSGTSRETIEIHAGLRRRTLSDHEHAARQRMQRYAGLRTQTRDLWNEIKRTHPGAASRHHPQFRRFDNLRRERDALAAEFSRDATLHRRFAHYAGVSWDSVVTHARNADDDHRRTELLSEEERLLENIERIMLDHADESLRNRPTAELRRASTGRGDPVRALQATTELLRRTPANDPRLRDLRTRWRAQLRTVARSPSQIARLQSLTPQLTRLSRHLHELAVRARIVGRHRI